MISPDMFSEFVLDDLTAFSKEIDNTMYHLDGKGELPHLDQILSIPELKALQWVPGDGALTPSHWIDVYKKVRASGKSIQLVETTDEIDDLFSDISEVVNEIGKENIFCRIYNENYDYKTIKELCDRLEVKI